MDAQRVAGGRVGRVLGYGGKDMSPVLPPKDPSENKKKTIPTSVTLPIWMQERLDQLAEDRNYRSRSEVIVRLLEWALHELEREERIAAERQQEAEPAASRRPKLK